MKFDIKKFLLTFAIMLVFYVPLTGFTDLSFWVAGLLSLPGTWVVLYLIKKRSKSAPE
ncbi:MAG: hypothetical protein GY729_00055 [Desulfobacteraceae bacterium]|nr:hypothetical protein [Desulfobacteraceae bacterium]